MAKVIISDCETILEAKKLTPNTHKIVGHCVEYYTPDSPIWHSVNGRAASSLVPCDIIISHGISGWLNPKDAAANMMTYKAQHPAYSFRISRYLVSQSLADEIMSNSIWREREVLRMTDGTYEPLPWASEAWFKARHEALNHYAHVSTNKDGMIAFTENNDKGSRDIQKRMAPGRYLSEYYSSYLNSLPNFDSGIISVEGHKVTIDPIQHYARMFAWTYGDTCTLQFAATQEDMIRVYQKGPDSCMTFRNNQFSGHIHPVAVYAAGDLNLAYLLQHDGSITARALVWPANKAIGRLYGDCSTLLFKLLEQGYSDPQGTFDKIRGARMLQIDNKEGGGYIMPFLDACGAAYHEKDGFWIMGSNLEGYTETAGNQNGLDNDGSSESEYDYTCEYCEEGTNDTYTVNHTSRPNGHTHEQSWCEYCHDSHAWQCAETHESYSNSVASVLLANGDRIATINLDNYFQCAVNSNWYHIDDCAGCNVDGDNVSNDAVEDKGLVQDNDGAWGEPNPDQLALELEETQATEVANPEGIAA